MMVNGSLSDFIKVYDGAVPKTLCDSLISKFDSATKEQKENDNHKFVQVNINANLQLFQPEFQKLCTIFTSFAGDYQRRLKITHFPKQNGYEQFRIKKYVVGDYFKDHVDVGDYDSARRYLSLFVYLNDGGGTKFFDKTIESKPGTLVIFPPLWLFPHSSVITDTKYFLSTYLHYL